MGKILVIDDEDAIVLVLTMALERYGFNVEIAKDGMEGIKKFDEGQFDLVITDIRMNNLDGHGVLRHIRNSQRKFTPTVGISGTPWHLQKSDFDAILAKPFSIQPLIDTVKNLTTA
ncbi:response regulator [Thermodesulfobacteriota bacterium]